MADYRHREKRKNNPDAGLATYNFKETKRVQYSYDPHLDPQIVWAGKAEHTSFEVDTVSLHIHERISTQAILKSVQRKEAWRQERLFAEPALGMDKLIEFYEHEIDWANRLILGDSLLVMNSLLERELMAGKVQMIYMDPPYGIAYGSNFQALTTSHDVKEKDESLTREPEQIKAYRDTWTLGVHSYLTYLRDRLLLAKSLLHESGSIFVQIGEENLHLVTSIMDEIFGRQNSCAVIPFRKKTMPLGARLMEQMDDFLLWYAKDKELVKYHQLYKNKDVTGDINWSHYESHDGRRFEMSKEQVNNHALLPKGARLFTLKSLEPSGVNKSGQFEFLFREKNYSPPANGWATDLGGMNSLAAANRLEPHGTFLRYVLYLDDYPVTAITAPWQDVSWSGFGDEKIYTVQTNTRIVSRCVLMATDPGDLVFDPTCGSGTTAFVAEQWGRRWITCDTSRVSLALSRQRIMTAVFPYYRLANKDQGVDTGFDYENAPHITLRSIVQNEPQPPEPLYDMPKIDDEKVRLSGPFTVEAIPIASRATEDASHAIATSQGVTRSKTEPLPEVEPSNYVSTLIGILGKDGVTFPKGRKLQIENLRTLPSSGLLQAEGTAGQNGSVLKVAFSFGPRYGPVGVRQVDEALRLANRMGFDMLIFAGFAIEPEARAIINETPIPKLQVQYASISPDVILADLLKTTRGSQLFTVFGEPDLAVDQVSGQYVVKLRGVDIYDPITGEVHQSAGKEVPAWFLDDDYDGLTFRISQAFFPKEATARNPWDKLENALNGVVDARNMKAFRGLESLPFKLGSAKRIAVKVIDVRGNDVIVVRSLETGGLTGRRGETRRA